MDKLKAFAGRFAGKKFFLTLFCIWLLDGSVDAYMLTQPSNEDAKQVLMLYMLCLALLGGLTAIGQGLADMGKHSPAGEALPLEIVDPPK